MSTPAPTGRKAWNDPSRLKPGRTTLAESLTQWNDEEVLAARTTYQNTVDDMADRPFWRETARQAEVRKSLIMIRNEIARRGL